MCKEGCNSGRVKAAGLLALRLALAFVFIYAGWMKLTPAGHAMAAGMFGGMGLPFGGEFWAYFIGSLELAGGIMVALGLFARYAAGVLAIIMLVAIFIAHLKGPLTGLFVPVLALGGLLSIATGGAGDWRVLECECCCKRCKAAMNEEKGDDCCGSGGCGSCDKK
jgi:uncharacterized membrane protein YphA (DoxX/SURF4 family)